MRESHINLTLSSFTIIISLFVTETAGASVFQNQHDSIPQSDYISDAVIVKGKRYPYLLLPPKNIVKGESYPLVLFLHGAGERGNDNKKQKRHFPELMASPEYQDLHSSFVLAPQCPRGESWVDIDWSSEQSTPHRPVATKPLQGAIRALEKVVAKYPIDLESISLTGLSMGGYGTWDLAMRYPYWFAAAIPICGGGDENNVTRLAGLKLQVWHGKDDKVVPATRSQNMVEAMSNLDMAVDYFELLNTGHNSWHEAYRRKEFLNLLFSAKRDLQQIQKSSAELLSKSMKQDERVVFFGDSITQSGNLENGYVDLIRKALKSEDAPATIIPAGISGHKVPDLLQRLDADVLEKNPTVVFIYIGINDVWHSQMGSGTDIHEYGEGLRKIIQAIHKSGSKAVLATPSVIGEKPNGENPLDKMLEEYAEVSRKIAKEEQATLCDLRLIFVNYLRVFNPEGLKEGILTTDGVHLNKTGNILVAIESSLAIRQAALGRD
jgi:lysophospholipase L1-like esterase/predicted esterase